MAARFVGRKRSRKLKNPDGPFCATALVVVAVTGAALLSIHQLPVSAADRLLVEHQRQQEDYLNSKLQNERPHGRSSSSMSRRLVETTPRSPPLRGWQAIQVVYDSHEKETRSKDAGTTTTTKNSKEGPSDVVSDFVMQALDHKTQGYFVELIAHDPKEEGVEASLPASSHTLALEEQLQWQGLCVEPNPKYWAALAHRKCKVVAAAIGRNSIHKNKPNNSDNTTPSVKPAQLPSSTTVPFRDILREFGAPTKVDYLALNVRGAEYFVLQDFPFGTSTISILSMKQDYVSDPLRTLLQKQGYRFLGVLSAVPQEEALWCHESVCQTLRPQALQRLTQLPKTLIDTQTS